VQLEAGHTQLLLVHLDAAAPGVAYGCSLRSAGGELVPVGSWTPSTAGDATWAVEVPTSVAEGATDVVLTGSDGAVLASATLQ
jgi:hypothetical protein